MVSKNQLKLIKSLHQKKYRNEHGLFFVEGKKTVTELLNSNFNLFQVFVTQGTTIFFKNVKAVEISNSELKKISSLQNPNGVLGVFKIPKPIAIDFSGWLVVLDDVRDPGNLGTIILFMVLIWKELLYIMKHIQKKVSLFLAMKEKGYHLN